jgi:transcriptional regulator with XRE-family HTH domain
MTRVDLKAGRTAKGWSQTRAAARLGVSQAYLAMLENGSRRVTRDLGVRAMTVYGLPPTALPAEGPQQDVSAGSLAGDLAALGYPGFAHLRPRRWRAKNPGQVLLSALAQDELEARLVEALPWLLLRYGNVDHEWLVREAKLRDLQNRLGFVASLARGAAARGRDERLVERLKSLEAVLDRSRLAREETLCRASLSEPERRWLQVNRPDEARHWNLLTDWTPDHLRHGA